MIETGGSFDLELQRCAATSRLLDARDRRGRHRRPGASRIIGTVQDITERKHAEETLRVQARTDPLTGLLNRDAILVELELRMPDPTHAAVAVLYVDLDRFKIVNDVLGHAAGDELLAAAAQRIASAVGDRRPGRALRRRRIPGGLQRRRRPAAPGAHRRRDPAMRFGDSFRFDNEEFTITTSIGIARAPDRRRYVRSR